MLRVVGWLLRGDRGIGGSRFGWFEMGRLRGGEAGLVVGLVVEGRHRSRCCCCCYRAAIGSILIFQQKKVDQFLPLHPPRKHTKQLFLLPKKNIQKGENPPSPPPPLPQPSDKTVLPASVPATPVTAHFHPLPHLLRYCP